MIYYLPFIKKRMSHLSMLFGRDWSISSYHLARIEPFLSVIRLGPSYLSLSSCHDQVISPCHLIGLSYLFQLFAQDWVISPCHMTKFKCSLLVNLSRLRHLSPPSNLDWVISHNHSIGLSYYLMAARPWLSLLSQALAADHPSFPSLAMDQAVIHSPASLVL